MLNNLKRRGLDGFGRDAWYLLVFLQPFNHFGALRILSTLVLLVCLVGHYRRNPPEASRHWTLWLAIAIACWAIAVSLLGPYPADSFHALRQDLLVQALMLTAAMTYVRSIADAWRIVGAALAGFAAVTALSTIEIIAYWTSHCLSLWVERSHDSFWGGYASTGAYYLPLLAGWLFVAPAKLAWKLAGWILFAVAAALVVLYGSRTPLITIIVAMFVLLVLLKRWRSLAGTAFVAFCLAGLIRLAPPGYVVDKYQSLLSGQTYVTNSGLSQRFSVWEGCWQVIRERPVVGYGYGWKKLALAINDGGFAERWRSQPDIAGYYLADGKAGYGKVNPHNYPLQVMFEIGIVGLLMALAFWAGIAGKGIAALRHGERQLRPLAAFMSLLVVLGGYAVSNLTNGYWVGGLANVSLVFAGCLLVLAAPGERHQE